MEIRIWLFVIIVHICKSHDDEQHHSRVKRATTFVPKNREEIGKEFWLSGAQNILQQHLKTSLNENVAKNVILFLGDGMSLATIAATRAYLGQIHGATGEETILHFEHFPHTGLSKTYCVDSQVADSACSATAYLSGVKGNVGTIGVTAAVHRQDCAASLNSSHHVKSFADWAQQAGKATGVVTTTRVTHASPAGMYAHTSERYWEDDTLIKASERNPEECPDIAKQLVLGETGSNLNVILGGGRRYFYPDTTKDGKGLTGKRHDKLNLIDQWKLNKRSKNATYNYVTNRRELFSASPTTDYLLGLFSSNHLSYHLDNNKEEPTLEEMTVVAINTLKKSPEGYFLFVEGGRIDHAHHDNMAKKSLDETVEFAKAVAVADALTSSDDTLIVVTSDHAHVMTLSGYAHRGNNILGFGGVGADGLPYSTLSYANGPGYSKPEKGTDRQDLRKMKMEHKLFRFPAMVSLPSETHGGDDVAVYAKGPWSHLFSGSYEQSYIPHAMGYASCIGSGLTACNSGGIF